MGRYVTSAVFGALFAGACGAIGDTDGDVDVEPQITGIIEVIDSDLSGAIDVHKVFSFAAQGKGVGFVSPNPAATCDEVLEVLDDPDHDPEHVYVAGKCALLLNFNYDAAAGFDGITIDNTDARHIVNVNCAMGEGVWNRVRGDRGWGYEFDGWWWQGGAGGSTAFSYRITGSDNVPQFDFDLGPNFHGQFIYDDTFPDPATGSLQGAVEAEACPGLLQR